MVLIKTDLALTAGVVAVMALRLAARRWLGARAAYGLWLLPLAAALAVLMPARVLTIPAPTLSPIPAMAPVAAPQEPHGSAEVIVATSLPNDPTPAIVLLWAAGALAAVGWFARGQLRFLRTARQGLAGPAAVGVFRPRVVVPGDFEARFSRAERTAILAHEAAHIALQHPRTNALVAVVRALHWFNPLVHLGAHLMRIDQELACDAAVVGERPKLRRLYAETLLKSQLSATPLPLGCYWPARAEHPLTRRVEMLNRPVVSTRARVLGGFAVAGLALVAGLGAWAAQPARVQLAADPAKPGQLRLSADRSEVSADGKTTTLSGDVRLKMGDTEVNLDRLVLPRPGDKASETAAWKSLDAYGPSLVSMKAQNLRAIWVDGRFVFPDGTKGDIAVRTVWTGAAWRSMLGDGAVMLRFEPDGDKLRVTPLTSDFAGHVQEETPISVRSGEHAHLILRNRARLDFVATTTAPSAEQLEMVRGLIQTDARLRSIAMAQRSIDNIAKAKADYERQAPIPAGFFERDPNAVIYLRGLVLGYDEIAPRARVHLADQATGKAWAVEVGTANTLRRGGITNLVGQQVDVIAFQTKDRACQPECKAVMKVIELPDGRKVYLGSPAANVPPAPPKDEKGAALNASDWRKAASLGATAADIVRAMQARGLYKDINPDEAVVVLPQNGGPPQVTAMKPLPPLPGQKSPPTPLYGTGFDFANPGAITLYPPGAKTFRQGATPDGHAVAQPIPPVWRRSPSEVSQGAPMAQPPILRRSGPGSETGQAMLTPVSNPSDRSLAEARLTAAETAWANAQARYGVGLMTLSDFDAEALKVLEADRALAEFTGRTRWVAQGRQPGPGAVTPLIRKISEVSGNRPPPGWRAFAAVFDGNAPVLLKGQVTEVEWIDPRVLVHMVDAKGRTWTIEGASPEVMASSGFDREQFVRGSQISVRGYQSKNKSCEPECRAAGRDVTFADGVKRMIGVR